MLKTGFEISSYWFFNKLNSIYAQAGIFYEKSYLIKKAWSWNKFHFLGTRKILYVDKYLVLHICDNVFLIKIN
jgi:hypothetical protein